MTSAAVRYSIGRSARTTKPLRGQCNKLLGRLCWPRSVWPSTCWTRLFKRIRAGRLTGGGGVRLRRWRLGRGDSGPGAEHQDDFDAHAVDRHHDGEAYWLGLVVIVGHGASLRHPSATVTDFSFRRAIARGSSCAQAAPPSPAPNTSRRIYPAAARGPGWFYTCLSGLLPNAYPCVCYRVSIPLQ